MKRIATVVGFVLVSLIAVPPASWPATGMPDRIVVHDPAGDVAVEPAGSVSDNPRDDLRVFALLHGSRAWRMTFRTAQFTARVPYDTNVQYTVRLTDPDDHYRYLEIDTGVSGGSEVSSDTPRLPHHPNMWEGRAVIACDDYGCHTVSCDYWLEPDQQRQAWTAQLTPRCLRSVTFGPIVTGVRDRVINHADDTSTDHIDHFGAGQSRFQP